MKEKQFIAILLAKFLPLGDQFECEAEVIPLKIVNSTNKAYELFIEYFGELAFYGIESNGDITYFPRKFEGGFCGNDEEDQEVKKDALEILQKIKLVSLG